MIKLNNSFTDTRNNPLLLLIASLMTFLTITFLVIPLTANAAENTSTSDETNHLSIENDPSVHNHQEQPDNDEEKNETTSTEDESQDVTEQQEDGNSADAEDNLDAENEDSIEAEIEEDNSTNQDESDREDVTNNDENDSESVDEDLDIENSEDIDNESEEEGDNISESEEDEENDVEAAEEDKEENKEKSDKKKDEKPKLAALNASKSNELKKGDRDERVIQMKKDLEKLGFKVPGNGTNLFGTQTEKKVKAFQKYFGLSITGTFNNGTMSKLKEQVNSSLQRGKRHNNTVKLKKDLAYLGMPVPGNGTTLYGKDTESVVKKFQKKYNLTLNGIADEITLQKINQLLTAPLSNGMRREDVKSLKKDLSKLGFKVPGNGTNLYGKQTEKKVKQFQKYFGLSQTGTINEITTNKIQSILSSPLQRGKRHVDTQKLKNDLAYLGMPVPGNRTQLFGKDTQSKVTQFQKKYNLAVNGIADEITLQKINNLLTAPLSNGMRREDVKTLKSDLANLGFKVPGNGTNLYGKQTESKVKQFQKYFGLSQTGTINKSTANKIQAQLNIPLQNGNRNKATVTLKNNLKKLGFKVPGNGTTLYGKSTTAQVKSFQKYYNLAVSGMADSVTLNKITSVLNNPLQNGKRHNNTKKLKADLGKIGYSVPGNGTTLFGSKTEQMVKLFQKDYNLAVSGIAEEVTLKKIADIVKISSKKIVYLDAGHGGYDPGSSANGLKEKDLTLDIAKRTASKLRAAGLEVIMSRTTDKYLSLSQRTSEANKANADIFVSIHINAGKGTGIETWRMANAPKSKESNALATHIQNETIKQTKMRDRGVKNGDLHVNRESKMPSSLIEVGFIDTVADANKLKNASFLNKAATGITNGIKKFFNIK